MSTVTRLFIYLYLFIYNINTLTSNTGSLQFAPRRAFVKASAHNSDVTLFFRVASLFSSSSSTSSCWFLLYSCKANVVASLIKWCASYYCSWCSVVIVVVVGVSIQACSWGAARQVAGVERVGVGVVLL